MLPRTLTAFTPLSGSVVKAANAPRPAIENALRQLRAYVSRELRKTEKEARVRYKKGFHQGREAGFNDVIGKIPDMIEQQQQLMGNWLSWLTETLEQRLPDFLITPSVLNAFLSSLSSEFDMENATLWIPESVSQEAWNIAQRCTTLGIASLKVNIHDEQHAFRLEAGPLVWIFDAKKQVVQHVVWQLGQPQVRSF
jgi:Fe-S cluster biosynthesis and repair protein YggX